MALSGHLHGKSLLDSNWCFTNSNVLGDHHCLQHRCIATRSNPVVLNSCFSCRRRLLHCNVNADVDWLRLDADWIRNSSYLLAFDGQKILKGPVELGRRSNIHEL